ncbi:hypothetical protein ACFL6F_02140 [Planctomycetota bacterium]
MDKVEISCSCSRRYRVKPQENKHILFACAGCGRKIRIDSKGAIVSIKDPEIKIETLENGSSDNQPGSSPEETPSETQKEEERDSIPEEESEEGPDEEDAESDSDPQPEAKGSSRESRRRSAAKTGSKGILIKVACVLLCACAAGAGVLIFWKNDKTIKEDTYDPSVITVQTVPVKIQDFTFHHQMNVTFLPVKSESVSLPAEMKVTHISVTMGDHVTIGQKLMTLDFKDDISRSQRALETEELDLSGQITACKVDGSETALKKMADLQQKLDLVQEKKKKVTELLKYRVIRSGINGRIHDVRVKAGDTAGPGDIIAVISREEELYFPVEKKYLPPELVSFRIRIANQTYTGKTGILPGGEKNESHMGVFFENTGRSQKSGVPVGLVLTCVSAYPGVPGAEGFTGRKMFVVRKGIIIEEINIIAGAEDKEWIPLETFELEEGDCGVVNPSSEVKKGVKVTCVPYKL